MPDLRPAAKLLAEMGMTEDDILKATPIDKRICRCGHAMSRHNPEGACSVGRMQCHCQGDNRKPVLIAENIEVFRFAPAGSGNHHALSRGILALAQKGKNAEWDPEFYKCAFDCDVRESLIPVVVDIHHSSGAMKILGILDRGREDKGMNASYKDRFACSAHYHVFSESFLTD